MLCTCFPARLAHSGQKRVLDPLEQELQVAVCVTVEQGQQMLHSQSQLPSSLQCHLKGRKLETDILGNDLLSLCHLVEQLHSYLTEA